MKMISKNDSAGSHGTLTLIEHPFSEMESPYLPSRPYRNVGGPGATRRPKVFKVVPRCKRRGRHVDQQTPKNNFHRVCLSPQGLMPDSTEP